MNNRFNDALAIQAGACNIAGMARTLVKACDEVQADGAGSVSNDPAVRLIIHQMAFIAGIISGAEQFYAGSYSRCDADCRRGMAPDPANELQTEFVLCD